MRRLLPDSLVGALAGFALGFLTAFPLGSLGIDVSGWPAVGLGIVGAVLGYAAGSFLQGPAGRARTVARWCAAMAVTLGVVAFLAGFVGPMIVRPDLPQGPLLGLFFTGPLGALAGAILGAVIGLLMPLPPRRRSTAISTRP